VTVCIAVMCEDSKKIVAGADRMLTSGMLSLAFEPVRPKIESLSDSCVMMTAGPALRDIELQKYVKRELAGMAGVAIPLIVEKVKDGYQAARRKKIEELYIKPRGLTLESYIEEGRGLVPDVAMLIDERLATYDYELEVLVAGVDSDGAHIYAVYNPGTAECFDSLGYHSIGSGEPHSAYSLIEGMHSHRAKLREAMWSVYEAKKRAERAPGVGETDDFVIIEQGRVVNFSEAMLEKLAELNKEVGKSREKWLKEFKPKLESIPIP
jgi:20S proteasome alpha/beta subunit